MSFLIRPVRAKETRPYPRHVRDHKAKIWEINWSAPMVGKRHNYPKQRPWGIISAPSPSLTHAATCRWPNCRVGRGEFVKKFFCVWFWLLENPTITNTARVYAGVSGDPRLRNHYTLLLELKAGSFFLSVWWSVSCRAVWVWGREKVKTGELSIHRGVRFEKNNTYSGVRSTQYGDLTLFANNSGLCAGILQHVVHIWKQTEERKSKRDICISRRVTRRPGSRRNTVHVWLTCSIFSAHFPFQEDSWEP